MKARAFLSAALLLLVPLAARAQAPSLLRCVATDSAPMISPDPAQPWSARGLEADILNEVLARRLKRPWVCTFVPWQRAQEQLRYGEADLLITIPTPERLEYALATDQPVIEMYLHVYTYPGHPKLKEIRKIRSAQDILRLGLKPVTNLGNNWHRTNIDAVGVETHYAPSDENIAMILASRRADIMIDTPITMNPMIESLGLSRQLEMTPARFGPVAFHILVSRKSPLAASMDTLNRAVATFIQDGTRERLTARYTTLRH